MATEDGRMEFSSADEIDRLPGRVTTLETSMTAAQGDISELQTAKASVSQAFGRGTYIPTNGSMDDLSGYGRFYSDNATHSATITNTPFTVAGFICEQSEFYQSLSGVTGKMQIAYSIISGTYTERRRFYMYTGGVGWRWTNWVTTVNAEISYSEQSNSLSSPSRLMSTHDDDVDLI